jgi:hypothetical protein
VPRRRKPPSPSDAEVRAEQLREQALREKLELPQDLRDWLNSPEQRKLREEMQRIARLSGHRERSQPAPEEKPRGGRKPSLTRAKIEQGIAFLNRNPGIEMEVAYPALRKLLHTDASDSTLWRRIWSKRRR